MGDMNAGKTAGLLLIVAGLVGLALGTFSFTKETHQAQVGPITLTVQDRQTVSVPVWAGVGSIVLGAALLLLGFKKN